MPQTTQPEPISAVATTAPVAGPILEMRGITKRFPGVLALSNVDFDVRPGEVHALVGENGAGKSTLMKILAGVYTRDAGEVIFQGQPVDFTTPRQAQVAGIATIYQELNQVPYLSVTENIFLGTEITRGIALSWADMHARARELLMKLHLDIDPRTPINKLGVGQQQMVEPRQSARRPRLPARGGSRSISMRRCGSRPRSGPSSTGTRSGPR